MVKQTLLGAESEVQWYIGTVYSDVNLDPVPFALKEPHRREVLCTFGRDVLGGSGWRIEKILLVLAGFSST